MKFFAVAMVIYGVFVLCWPLVGAAYASAYRVAASKVLGTFDGDTVEFRPSAKQPNMDTEIVAGRRGVRMGGRTYHCTRVVGYLMTAEFVALALATPVSLRRRVRVLVFGLAAVHLFIVFRLVVIIVWLYSTPDAPFTKYDFGSTGRDIVTWLVAAVASSLNASFFAPLAIWGALAFRRDELAALVGRGVARSSTDAVDAVVTVRLSTRQAARSSSDRTEPRGGGKRSRIEGS